MTHPGYRTLVRRIDKQFVVVSCDRGIFIEPRKAWSHGHYRRHWVLNTPNPHRVGTFINPRAAVGAPKGKK